MADSLSTQDFADNARAGFFRRHVAWIALGIAAGLALGRLVPAVYLSNFSADCIHFPMFYRDVMVQGNPAGGWIWGGHSDLFPEVVVTFLARAVVHCDGMFSLFVAAGVNMAAYVAGLVALYRLAGGRGATSYAAAVMLFFTVLLLCFDSSSALNFQHMVVMSMHTGINVMALVCLGLSLHVLRAGQRRHKTAFLALAAACFLSGATDPLFLVTFPLPFIATLAVAWALYGGRLRGVPALAGNILLCTAAGHFLAHRIFPARVDAAPYTHYSAGAALAAWDYVLKLCNPLIGSWLVVFIALDAVFVVFAAGMLVRVLRQAVPKRMPPALFILLLFAACLICCNWSATILAGLYGSPACSRYVRLSLLAPVFILLGWLNHRFPGRGNVKAVVAMSLATCCGALFFLPEPSPAYRRLREVAPVMREIMRREHITAGLADYWQANPVDFLSDDTVRLRAVYADGSLMHWVNNIVWFTGGKGKDGQVPGGARPEFRLIYMAALNPRQIRGRYGEPARIIPTAAGKDIWIYPPEKAITWNPLYEALSNDPPAEFHVPGGDLPTLVGKRRDSAMVALQDRSAAGYLTYGPYLRLHAGRYRVAIAYTYPTPPAPGQPTGYDVVRWNKAMTRYDTIAQGALPFIDTAPHDAELEIHIADEDHAPVEVRTLYPGSGNLRIEGLRFTRVGD